MSETIAKKRAKIVLGVDDQDENRLMLQALIEAAGYTFIGARSGGECLNLCTRMTPRLILLDIQMPDLDGFETCKRLRENWQLAQVPIAFLTARKTAEDVTQGIKAGGNDFIAKPFDHAKLIERIEHWVNRRA